MYSFCNDYIVKLHNWLNKYDKYKDLSTLHFVIYSYNIILQTFFHSFFLLHVHDCTPEQADSVSVLDWECWMSAAIISPLLIMAADIQHAIMSAFSKYILNEMEKKSD